MIKIREAFAYAGIIIGFLNLVFYISGITLFGKEYIFCIIAFTFAFMMELISACLGFRGNKKFAKFVLISLGITIGIFALLMVGLVLQ